MRRPLPPSDSPRLPRWPLVAALLSTVLVAAGIVVWFTMPCVTILGSYRLCRTGDLARLPGVAQSGLVWLLFGLLWLLSWAFGAGIQELRRDGGGRRSLLRALSDVDALRPIVIGFGVVGVLLGVAGAALGRTQPVVMALGLLPGFVAAWVVLYRPPVEDVPLSPSRQLVEELIRRDSWLFRLRSLPLLRILWPNRPRRTAAPDSSGEKEEGP
jgi:hypothetical protein